LVLEITSICPVLHPRASVVNDVARSLHHVDGIVSVQFSGDWFGGVVGFGSAIAESVTRPHPPCPTIIAFPAVIELFAPFSHAAPFIALGQAASSMFMKLLEYELLSTHTPFDCLTTC